MCSPVQQLPRKGIFMLSYIPGKRYHFTHEECEGCLQKKGNCDKYERCGNYEILLNEIATAVRTINVFHVDSASRKKIINYYNKIEQEVLKSNGKR